MLAINIIIVILAIDSGLSTVTKKPSRRISSGLFLLLLFHGPDGVVIPTTVAFVTHSTRVVKSIGVDASVRFLLATIECVALLTHPFRIMKGFYVWTLVNSPLLAASLRLVLNHIWTINIRLWQSIIR